MSVTKADFVELLALRFGLTKNIAGEIYEWIFSEIGAAVREGHRIKVPGFGTFSWRSRKARNIANPKTGAPMRLPKRWAVTFRASRHQKRFA